MKINLIAAVGQNNEMGLDNKLLWHIPEDLKRFKKITEGKPVIMGRKTFESIGKPLPNRKNIVLTNGKPQQFPLAVVTAKSVEGALIQAQLTRSEEVFIIGGAGVYQSFMAKADKIYLTVVHAEFKADTFFPKLDLKEWEIVSEEDAFSKEYILTNYVYIRKEKKDDTKQRNRESGKSAPNHFNGTVNSDPNRLCRQDY